MLEVVPGGREDDLEVRSELRVVEVELHETLRREGIAELVSKPRFQALPHGVLLRVDEYVLHQLLGDGRAARVLLVLHVGVNAGLEVLPLKREQQWQQSPRTQVESAMGAVVTCTAYVCSSTEMHCAATFVTVALYSCVQTRMMRQAELPNYRWGTGCLVRGYSQVIDATFAD